MGRFDDIMARAVTVETTSGIAPGETSANRTGSSRRRKVKEAKQPGRFDRIMARAEQAPVAVLDEPIPGPQPEAAIPFKGDMAPLCRPKRRNQ